MKKSIGVIGQGFVGGSLTTVFSERGFDVWVYDKAGKIASGGLRPGDLEVSSNESVDDQIKHFVSLCELKSGFSGVYFVCLPTPMFEDGEADLSIVEGVLKALSEVPVNVDAKGFPMTRIAVVKSTVPPGSTEKWNKLYENTRLRVIFSPEFLTEANALNDMRTQNRIILGGPRPHINRVKQLFQSAFPDVPIIKTSSTTAEMVKYFTNVQLASRVVLSCELAQVVEALDKQGMNIDFDKVCEYSKYDHRLGGTHMNVPGHDGIMGARGHCFPKDLNALIFVAKKLGVEPTVMSAVWEKNLEVVPEEHRDWEKMVGRAVSRKNK